MIKSKKELKYYIQEDLKRYNLRYFDRFLFNENYYICSYLKTLRRLEYYTNIKKNIFQKVLYYCTYWNYKRKCNNLRIKIGVNTCGPGLYLPHIGLIRVATKAKVGSHCTIGPDVVLGTKGTFDNVPTIGDNVEIALGAKVIGKVFVGNNAIVAPNSVVIKDVPENAIVSGVPAQIIKVK